jgi:hypothetical protein
MTEEVTLMKMCTWWKIFSNIFMPNLGDFVLVVLGLLWTMQKKKIKISLQEVRSGGGKEPTFSRQSARRWR